MEHPKCRTCGDRHKLGPCPVHASPTPKAAPVAKAAPKPPEPARNASKQAFDRAAYQREYMRKYLPAYRAKQREKSAS